MMLFVGQCCLSLRASGVTGMFGVNTERLYQTIMLIFFQTNSYTIRLQLCLILLNYFLLCWWIYRNQFTKYHDCWLCIYLFGFAPSSLCVLLAYYSSCSCQGSKGGNINPSWGEPHVFGNTSAIWHWECGSKMIEQQHRCTNCTQTCYMHACMHI